MEAAAKPTGNQIPVRATACGRPTKDQGKAQEYREEQRIKPEE